MKINEIIAKIKKYGVRRLAREMGISEYTIYGWTNKEKKPQTSNLLKIAKQFGVEVEE